MPANGGGPGMDEVFLIGYRDGDYTPRPCSDPLPSLVTRGAGAGLGAGGRARHAGAGRAGRRWGAGARGALAATRRWALQHGQARAQQGAATRQASAR